MKTKKTRIYVLSFLMVGIIVAGFFENPLARSQTKGTTALAQANAQPISNPSPEAKAPSEHHDFWTAAQNIEVKTEGSQGDVVVAGANIKISGDVQGYVMAAGANVSVDAPVGNDLWAAGANVVVNAPIADNATLAGSSVILEQSATVGGELRVAGNTTMVKNQVIRDVNIAAANATISSEIGGNVTANVENLTIEPGAVIHGNLVVNSPNEPVISPQAQVLGKIDFHRTENAQRSTTAFGSWLGNWFLTFLWITILGLAAIWFSSVWTNRVAQVLKAETGKSFLVGLVTMLLAPIVFILLLITVIGLPLAFILGAASLVAFLLSGAFIAYLVGDLVLTQLKRWETSNVLKIIVGALIITLIMSLPWIGWVAKLAVMFFGVGGFILERRDLFRKLREQGMA